MLRANFQIESRRVATIRPKLTPLEMIANIASAILYIGAIATIIENASGFSEDLNSILEPFRYLTANPSNEG